MADDVAITAGSGTTIAADERTINSVSVKIQRISPIGASAIAVAEATCTGAADQLVAARETRRRVVMTNISSTTAYIGPSGVATTDGLPLAPGAVLSLETTAAVYGATTTGTATIRVLEEYDS